MLRNQKIKQTPVITVIIGEYYNIHHNNTIYFQYVFNRDKAFTITHELSTYQIKKGILMLVLDETYHNTFYPIYI